MAYSMVQATVDEIAAQDPFGGSGVFLAYPAHLDQIVQLLEETYGIVAAVSWPGKGAWVDTRRLGMTPGEICGQWSAAIASRSRGESDRKAAEH